MRFFLDTEFIESGPTKPIQLISIGIVSQMGREYYAISSDYNKADASEWVWTNVITNLESPDVVRRKPLWRIAADVIVFVASASLREQNEVNSDPPEFWGYYADYDWVVFCQMFGAMVDLPTDWPKYCRDLKQLADDLGGPILPKQATGQHNALADARWNKAAWEFLTSMTPSSRPR